MSRTCSVAAGRVYGKARVCRLWGEARSTHYARQAAVERPVRTERRGRKPMLPDGELVASIRAVLAEAVALGFRGEGYRKVWAGLRQRGIPMAKARVRRLMGQHGLQAPHRPGTARARPAGARWHPHAGGAQPHVGRGCHLVRARRGGVATMFVGIDSFIGDVVGIHAARPGTRFEALEAVRQGVREHFGPLQKALSCGMTMGRST